jgi:oxygen-independent coproporphyrinogen-3 oxidase
LHFDTVYFGGGTPSVTPDELLAELVDLIRSSFPLKSPQMTFEGHVRSLTPDKIRSARSIGFNRLSTGVQTFDPTLRHALNLTPTEHEIRNCVATAYQAGFDDFNLDLMYNLPGQTLSIWKKDLKTAISMSPTGIDVYETVIDERTPIFRQVKRGQLTIERNPHRLADSYSLSEEILSAAEYQQRNLFVWDRPGFSNRLVGYQGELRDSHLHIVGAGLSAYSLINGIAYMNEARKSDYIRQVRDSGFGVKTHHRCSQWEAMQRFMIMSLEEFEFDRERFAGTFAEEMDAVFVKELTSFHSRGLIEGTDKGYRLTPKGRAWATTMTVEFFGPDAMEEILRARIDDAFIGGMTDEDRFLLPIFGLFHPALLFRNWHNFGLLRHYLQYLRQSTQGWLLDFLRLAYRTLRMYGMPEWKAYLAILARKRFSRRPKRPIPVSCVTSRDRYEHVSRTS